MIDGVKAKERLDPWGLHSCIYRLLHHCRCRSSGLSSPTMGSHITQKKSIESKGLHIAAIYEALDTHQTLFCVFYVENLLCRPNSPT